MTEHVTRIIYVPDEASTGYGYRAQCSCGWDGGRASAEVHCKNSAAWHLSVADIELTARLRRDSLVALAELSGNAPGSATGRRREERDVNTPESISETPPDWLVGACKPWEVHLMPDGYNSVFGLTTDEVAANVWRVLAPRLAEVAEHAEAIIDDGAECSGMRRSMSHAQAILDLIDTPS